MDETAIPPHVAAEAARLDRTLKTLRDRVKEQEDALNKLRDSMTAMAVEPSEDPVAHLRQLRTLRAAFDVSTESEPFLPSADSPIPALLALRNTHRTIVDAEAGTRQATDALAKTQRLLALEEADLHAAERLSTALRARVLKLEKEAADRARRPPARVARDYMRTLEAKRDGYDRETGRLIQAFNAFVNTHLAPMLATEAAGGPVVGENLQVQDDSEEEMSDTGRRRRRRGATNQDDEATELQELAEDLLNNLIDGEAGGYVKLRRESAAARFLVRSMVAQFHPRDATRLRLIDFGREIED